MISMRSWLAMALLLFASIALGHPAGGGGGGGGAGGAGGGAAHSSGGGSLAADGGGHVAAGGGGGHIAAAGGGSHAATAGSAAAHAGWVSPADEVRGTALMYSGAVSSETLKGATVSHETIEGRPATVVHVKAPLTDTARRKLHRKGFYESETRATPETFFCVRDPRDPLRCFEFTEPSAERPPAAQMP
jgi:hypothetical protein